MNVTDDVLNDLLTLYLAGDASTDTRALIEERARLEPAFAAKMSASRELDRTAARAIELPGVLGWPPGDVELRALRLTRNAIFFRTLFLACAILFMLVPLFFLAPSRLHPSIVRAFWYLAAVAWFGCWSAHRLVRKAGL
jgi:hypothetical protein